MDFSFVINFDEFAVAHSAGIGQSFGPFDPVTSRTSMNQVIVFQGEVGPVFLREKMIPFPII